MDTPTGSGPHNFLRTDHVMVDGVRREAGELVFLGKDPYRIVAHVENLATGSCWVDLKGVENHRYRSVRVSTLEEAFAAA